MNEAIWVKKPSGAINTPWNSFHVKNEKEFKYWSNISYQWFVITYQFPEIKLFIYD